jgi:mannosylglucosylglycerate synthase
VRPGKAASPRAAGSAGGSMEVHFKLFGTDGVSLQSQELTKALRTRGWRVHSCASDVPDAAAGLRVPELSYQSAEALSLRRRIFQPDGGADDRSAGRHLVAEIEERARAIRRRVERYADEHGIRLLHVRNITSLPYNLPATLAFQRLVTDRPDIHFLLQHHDLYWEGPNARSFVSPFAEIAELIDTITCPDRPNTTHVLINPIAAQALRERKGITGVVVPDGFDFDREVMAIDDAGFRGRLEVLTGRSHEPVASDDLVVAMPARVAINKAIELAIQFVSGLERRRAELENSPGGLGARGRSLTGDSKIVLLLPQGEDLEENRAYFDRLVAYAAHLGVTLAYGGGVVVPDRKYTPGDRDHYPFYSTYQTIDMVCYPPEHEGFGNQAIEAVWARRPLAVLEYPVFKAFVRDHVPHYISLGDVPGLGRLEEFGGLHLLREDVLQRALDEAITVLRDHEMERRWVEENATSLREFCGIDTVCERYLELYDPARRPLSERP